MRPRSIAYLRRQLRRRLMTADPYQVHRTADEFRSFALASEFYRHGKSVDRIVADNRLAAALDRGDVEACIRNQGQRKR